MFGVNYGILQEMISIVLRCFTAWGSASLFQECFMKTVKRNSINDKHTKNFLRCFEDILWKSINEVFVWGGEMYLIHRDVSMKSNTEFFLGMFSGNILTSTLKIPPVWCQIISCYLQLYLWVYLTWVHSPTDMHHFAGCWWKRNFPQIGVFPV